MNEKSIFEVPRLPARLNIQQTAKLLGFLEYEIPVLMRLKLLKPLGAPRQNSHKYFAAVEILEFARDRDWLDRATKAVARSWRQRIKKTDSAPEVVV